MIHMGSRVRLVALTITGIVAILGFLAVILVFPDPLQLYFEIAGACAIGAIYLFLAYNPKAKIEVHHFHKQDNTSLDY